MKTKMLWLIPTVILLVGCGESTEDESSKTNQPSQPAAECAKLTEAQCMENEACMPMLGMRVIEPDHCVDPGEYLGCTTEVDCGDALSYARDSAGELWIFPNTCTPDGWPVEYPESPDHWLCTDEPSDPGTETKCSKLSYCECVGVEGCVRTNFLSIDESANCAWNVGPIGRCATIPEEGCLPGMNHARSESGNLYLLHDSCIPDGWTVVHPPTEPELLCLPDEYGFSPKQDDCTALTEAQCEAEQHCFSIRGRPINEADQCREDMQFAGCASWCHAVDGTATAKSPSGDSWWFPSWCIPGDWIMEPHCGAHETPCNPDSYW